MYIMLCEFLVSILFSFKLTHKKAKSPRRVNSPKTSKFFGRKDVTSVTFPKGKARRRIRPNNGRGEALNTLVHPWTSKYMYVKSTE